MKHISFHIARLFALCLAHLGVAHAEQPPLLASGIEIVTSNERTSLVRATGRLSSTVDVKVTNTSGRLLEAPLHVIITFTPLQGGNLNGLTMAGMQGGIGLAPYQTFYKDLSAAIGEGLDPGAHTTFTFTFERPSTTSASYALAVRGVRNIDPVVSAGGPYAGQQGTPISFDASASTDPDGESLTFAWDFGDGGTAAGATPAHTFATSGLFTVVLTATDPRGGIVSRETQVSIAPPGSFALGRTRTLDGNGHPLGQVVIGQTGSSGVRTYGSDATSGFASLGGQPGDHVWRFSHDGYLTCFRKATLGSGTVRLIPYPWLAALNPQRTTLSLLNATEVRSPENRVALMVPAEAYGQVQSVALTDLHGQSLPLPLPHGWSPLAAFHFDAPGDSAENISGNVTVAPALSLALVRFDEANVLWRTESVYTGHVGDSLAFVIRKPGSYAVVVADVLPTGNPAAAVAGESLPAGDAPVTSPDVTAIGSVDPAQAVASLDPKRVTALASVDFTNAGQPLASGAWFSAEVSENYDMRDGQALKTPDYDATFYAYQSPGDVNPATAGAEFPLRPRILFGPDQLEEAHIQVNILAEGVFSGGILTPEGSRLTLAGLEIGVPAGMVTGPSAAEIRLISTTGLERFSGGIEPVMAFGLDLPPLASGAILDFLITRKLAPDSQFVLARLSSAGGESGLEPVLRLKSDGAGTVTHNEPAFGARLLGISGSGQYVVVPIAQARALITGTATQGGAPAAGAVVRVVDEPWLSVTDAAGGFFSLGLPGERVVIGTDPATGNSGQGAATPADAAAHAVVNLTLLPSGPRVVSTSPADGAERVAASSPISIQFNKVLDRVFFGSEAIVVTNPLGVVVAGSVILSTTGKEARFLPTHPLENAATYTVELADTLRDKRGNLIEGDREFSFTVLPFFERPPGAQLVIYEPGANNVPAAVLSMLTGYSNAEGSSHVIAHGSPGTADPDVPVILVNQNSGATATVLSKLDGSFANFIDAAEEDFIEAVFVNSNGTRVTVPATRQIYDNGRIGLYKYGGILEAENDEAGQVQVIIEPDAVPNRTVFRLDFASVQTLQSLLAENPPETGNVVGAFHYEITEGELPTKSPDVVFAATPAQLGLGPADDPEEHTYALCENAMEGDVPYYNIVDRMKYKDGALVTSSPPFPGMGSGAVSSLLMVPMRMAFGTRFTVTGRVLLGRESDLPSGGRVTDEEARRAMTSSGAPLIPVPNAIVFADAGGINQGEHRLRPGSYACKAIKNGFYACVVPYSPLQPEGVIVRALHPAFPSLRAFSSIVPDTRETVELPVGICHVVFSVPDNFVEDFTPPTVQIEPGPAELPVNEEVLVTVRIEDNVSVPVLREAVYDAMQSIAADPGVTLNASSASVGVDHETVTGRKREVKLRVTAQLPMRLALRLRATDEAGNEQTRVALLRFGEAPAVDGDLVLVDLDDKSPPRLLGSVPAVGSVFSGGTITLYFTEAMSRRCLEPGAVQTGGASILSKRLSADQRTLVLTLGQMSVPVSLNSSIESPLAVTVQLNPSLVTDLAANGLDGDNMLSFRLPADRAVDLPGTSGAVAVTLGANHIFTLRNNAGAEEVVVHPPGANQSSQPVGRLGVPAFPRVMLFLPNVTFFDPDPSPPPSTQLAEGANPLSLPGKIRTANLLAVTGGVTGEDQVGPWLWLIDVSDPTKPVRLASSLVTADFTTAASILKWSPPRLGVGVFAPEGGRVMMVNVQALILGSRGYVAFDQAFGIDLNFDGDYVDAGERPPVPRKGSLFGLEDQAEAPNALSFNDFDMMGGGSHMVAVSGSKGIRPSQLHVLRWPGVLLDGSDGVLDLPTATYRVLLDPAFPLEDVTGVNPVPAAILAGGNRVLVVSLADPERPVLVRNVLVAPEGQTLFFLGETGRAELIVAGKDGMRAISRQAIGSMAGVSPETAFWTPLALGGGRVVGASVMELATFSPVTGTRVLRRAPRIGVIQFRDPPAPTVGEIRQKPEGERGRFVGGGLERGFLRPVLPRGGVPGAEDADGIETRDPSEHHYILVRASGVNGTQIRVGAQSLMEVETASDVAKCPLLVTDRSPEIIHMQARRMSDVVTSDDYNLYLAGPFVLVVRPLDAAARAELGDMDGRQALWSGDFTRAFLASDPAAGPDILPYMASESGIVVRTGVAASYRSLRAEYQDSQNPSFGAAPRMMGGLLDLQSGEVSLRETDVAVEGRHQDLVFRRAYQSQSYYMGALGRNWDHNFNARIRELGEGDFPPDYESLMMDRGDKEITAGAGDALLVDGAGSVLTFRKISQANGNMAELPGYENDPALNEFFGANGRSKVATFYESQTEVYSFLVRLLDGKWMLVGVGGNRMYFHGDGRLDRLVGNRSASVITCHYRPRDGLLGEVRGDNGGRIRFGYYYPALDTRRTGPIDLVSDSPAKCSRMAVAHGQLSAEPGGQRVEFDYDAFGNLTSAEPSWRKPVRYAYDENDPTLLRRFGEDDGGTYPEATISYVDGMAKTIITGGETLLAGGAVKTTAERFQGGASTVTFGAQGATPTQIGTDARGRPKSFGGRAMEAGEDGALSMVQTANEELKVVFDESNPVRRFRGNAVRTERRALRGGPPRVSKTVYDGGPFNRPLQMTDINGIQTEFTHLAGEVREVTGGLITKQTLINTFGQPTAVSFSGGVIGIQHQPLLDLATGLPAGVNSNTTLTNSRDDIGRVDRQTQGAGGFDLRFDPDTGRLSYIAPLAAAEQPQLSYTYDGQGRLATETLAGGGKSVQRMHEYKDPQLPGKATKVTTTETGMADTVTEVEFDEFSRALVTSVDGVASEMTYNGTVLTGLDSVSLSRNLVLDTGARVSEVTQNGVTTHYGYDSADRPITVRTGGRQVALGYVPGADGNVTERVRTRVISAPEAIGLPVVSETLGYDGAGRLESITSTNGRIRGFEYHSNGVLRQMTINGYVARQTEMDQTGRVVSATLGNLRRTLTGYDPGHGRPVSETVTWLTSGRSLDLTHTYDATGRRTGTVYPNGSFATGYDAFGNVTRREDPDGVAVGFDSSPLGTLRLTTFADGSQATFLTGPARQPGRTDSAAGSEIMSYGGDAGSPDFGHLTGVTMPDGTSISFSQYNDYKQPEQMVMAGLVTQELQYDALGRVTDITSDFGDGTAWSREFDALDRMSSVKLGGEVVKFAYNAFENLAGEKVVSGGDVLGEWQVERDVLDRTLAESYPSGLRLEFVPDVHGQPTQVSGTGIDEVDWIGAGLPERVRYVGGAQIRWVYDSGLRVERIEYLPPGVETPTAGFEYDLTAGGRVLSERRLHEGRRDVYKRNGALEAMRITGAVFGLPDGQPDEATASAQSRLDGFSFSNGELYGPQLTSHANPATGDARGFFPAIVRESGSNRINTLDGVAVVHDARGAMSQFPVWVQLPGAAGLTRVMAQAEWDALGGLSMIERDDDVTVRYTRDGQGRIALREVVGPTDRCKPGTTRYFWAGSRLLEERDAGDVDLPLIRRYHYLAGKLVLLEAANGSGGFTRLIPLQGLNGSVGGYMDEAGVVLSHILYGLYGLPVVPGGDASQAGAADDSPLRFHGAFFDMATGLYEMGQRHLHPLTGGFIERDSRLFGESLAWFTAFNGDPAGRVDPGGALSEEIEILGKIKEQAEAAQGLYEPARGLATGGFNKDSILGNGTGLAKAGFGLWLTTQDEEMRKNVEEVQKVAGQLKDGVDLLKTYHGHFQGSPDEEEKESVFKSLKDPSGMLLLDSLSKDGMELSLAKMSADSSVIAVKGKLLHAPKLTDSYEAGMKAQLDSYKRASSLLALGNVALKAWGDQALGDKHKTQVAQQLLTGLGAAVQFAEQLTRQRGPRELVNLRTNPVEALKTSFNFGFELGKLGIVATNDPDVVDAYLVAVKQFEDDGGLLTVGSGILATLGADDSASLLQSIHDTKIDVTGAFQKVFENAAAERERRQQVTEFYLRALSAP